MKIEDQIDEAVKKMNENRDFLQSNFVLTNFFVTCGVPMFTCMLMRQFTGQPFTQLIVTDDLLSSDLQAVVKTVLILSSLKAAACLFLIFNPFDKKSR